MAKERPSGLGQQTRKRKRRPEGLKRKEHHHKLEKRFSVELGKTLKYRNHTHKLLFSGDES